tara:strand:+ start:45724 stop:46416 length:693 start_codon:yes stop_codon:yes gene_type:complete
MKLLVTCEHGGNDIPAEYKKYFIEKDALKTHRGYDLGAINLFNYLAPLSDASFYSTTSRLLVELNRSLFHKQLFSEFTKGISKDEKAEILKQYYIPYRSAVEHKIAAYIAAKQQVFHLSIHSFTPQLNEKKRNCDIGLLYDSTKNPEQQFCKNFKAALLKQNPNLNVRSNYPYLGKADGFTTFLRKLFPTNYLGVEIEINQKFVSNEVIDIALKQAVYNTIDSLKTQYTA